MNKIVCNVCGTSYPENAAQCPICGYVQSTEVSASTSSGQGNYTYVKGGRFSKTNVKKRNQANIKSQQVSTAEKKKKGGKPSKNSNVGTIILIVVLLLAILSVAGYIALRFFLPNDYLFEGLGDLTISAKKQEFETAPTEIMQASEPDEDIETTVSLDCTAIILDNNLVELDGANATHQLTFKLEPANTPDVVTFQAADESVAVVDENGMITAVGNGTTIVTISCGSASVQCTVNCIVEEEVIFELNRKEITFSTEGENWLLYNEDRIATDDIVWTSDDNSVAMIESGKVTAVGNGDTTVFGVYQDQTVACVIHCKFDETEETTGEISEASGNSAKTYMLHNPYGYADDVTINVGDQFILKLVDSDMNDADDTQWSVKNESVCSFSNNTVTAVGSGVTEVTATCEGKTYTCVVRVN